MSEAAPRAAIAPGALLDQLSRLRRALAVDARRRPGERPERQPVHVVYGGAHLFRHDTAARLGARALEALDAYAAEPSTLADALGIDPALAAPVHARVRDKLAREPVEDFRIDFEDGYGVRPDAEEDAHAAAAGAAVARGMAEGTLPPCVGVRIKPLTAGSAERAVRTLDRFVTALADASGGRLPAGLVVTLPKVTLPEQVDFLGDALQELEARLHLGAGAVGIELMVEHPRALFAEDGRAALPGLVAAGEGRVVAAHLGAYDHTAALGISARYQSLRHPACDFARQVMQTTLADAGVRLSDGATTTLPVPPHRGAADALSPAERAENRGAVSLAWRRHADDIRHALASGFVQGWDLHPAQLVSRFGTVYAYFLAERADAAARLRRFVEAQARATQSGGVFDDAATGRGLLNFFARGLACGALTAAEVEAETGLTAEQVRAGRFA